QPPPGVVCPPPAPPANLLAGRSARDQRDILPLHRQRACNEVERLLVRASVRRRGDDSNLPPVAVTADDLTASRPWCHAQAEPCSRRVHATRIGESSIRAAWLRRLCP